MTQKKLLIGSLSNDLLRVASLTQRGSLVAAQKFLDQAGQWTEGLKKEDLKYYIGAIVSDLSKSLKSSKLDLATAEKYLMYSILLQNYSLKLE